MTYNYEDVKENLFTDDGQRMFLDIRDKVGSLLKSSGAVRMQEAISGCAGDTWTMLACIDRLVELDEIREIDQPSCIGQHRVFVKT